MATWIREPLSGKVTSVQKDDGGKGQESTSNRACIWLRVADFVLSDIRARLIILGANAPKSVGSFL